MKNLLFCEFEDKLGKIFFSTNTIALEMEGIKWNNGFVGNNSYFPSISRVPSAATKKIVMKMVKEKVSREHCDFFGGEEDGQMTIFCPNCDKKIVAEIEDMDIVCPHCEYPFT